MGSGDPLTTTRWPTPSPRALGWAVALVVTLSSVVWFATATDSRGKTARLTADAWYYHAYLPSLVLDRDLDFRNEYRITGNWYRFGDTELGRPANVFGIGPALFASPLFLVGHGYARVAGHEADGFSRPEVWASLLASLLATLGALLAAARVLRRRLGGPYLSILVPVLIAAAGPVVYYAIRQPGYAHPFATLWVAWLIERWDASFDGAKTPRSLRTWAVLGLLLGASALARPQCATWAVILLWAVVDDVRRVMAGAPDRPWWAQVARTCAPRWAAGAALSLLVFAPQLLAWKALYGAYLLTPQGPGFMWWTESAWSEVLFSSRNGLLPWAPLMALAAIGLCASVRRTPRLTACLLAGVVLQVIANGAVWDWWAGGSFGGRRFDSTFLALCYGLGHLVIRPPLPADAPAWRLHTRRGLVAAALAVSIVLAAGNLAFAGGQSGPTVRIHGGAPAHQVLRAELPGPLAYPVSRLSALANLPARLAFAARHRVSLDAYDRIVGVHALGELYPGLNSFRGKTHETIRLDRAEAPFLVGFEPGPTPGTTRLARDSARVLVGVNRRDALTVTLRAAAAEDGAKVALYWNGAPLAAAPVGAGPTELGGEVPRPRRGVNVLEIRAPPGTVTYAVALRATADPLGRAR